MKNRAVSRTKLEKLALEWAKARLSLERLTQPRPLDLAAAEAFCEQVKKVEMALLVECFRELAREGKRRSRTNARPAPVSGAVPKSNRVNKNGR